MKQERFDFRGSAYEKKTCEEASALLGMNLSSFMRMSAMEKANQVLKDYNTIFLSNDARDAFLNALQNPKKPNKALKDAFKEYKNLVDRE